MRPKVDRPADAPTLRVEGTNWFGGWGISSTPMREEDDCRSRHRLIRAGQRAATVGSRSGTVRSPTGRAPRRDDPDDTVPRPHVRAQRDRPVEPLVRPPGRGTLPVVGQVRVLRGAQRRRHLRHRRRCSSTGSPARRGARSSRACSPATSATARPATAQYTIWLDDRGFVVEDGVILRHGQGRVPPDLRPSRTSPTSQDRDRPRRTSRSRSQPTTRHARAPGPALARTCSRSSSRQMEHSRTSGSPRARSAARRDTFSRTGYSGDLGYEVWVDEPRRAPRLGHALGRDRGPRRPAVRARARCTCSASRPACCCSTPTSTRAVRLERRPPLDARSSSAWAGCSRTSTTDDRPFIGRNALEREITDKTSRWRMRGLVVDWQDYDRVYNEAGLIPPKDHAPVVRRTGCCTTTTTSGRLRHELHVLADAPAPHRDRPRPTVDLAKLGPKVISSSPSTTTTSRSPRRRPACRLQPASEDERAVDRLQRRDRGRPTYDAIVVGGGHNGLVNGAYLAKSGLKTLVLERRHARRRRRDHRGAATRASGSRRSPTR